MAEQGRRARGPSQRVQVALACSACESRNYRTTRSRADGTQPVELKKFCKTCNGHTVHKETR